jgi:hypothetical protein
LVVKRHGTLTQENALSMGLSPMRISTNTGQQKLKKALDYHIVHDLSQQRGLKDRQVESYKQKRFWLSKDASRSPRTGSGGLHMRIELPAGIGLPVGDSS